MAVKDIKDIDLDFFMGTEEEYQQLLKEQRKALSIDEGEEQQDETDEKPKEQVPIQVLSKYNMEELDDDTFRILRRTNALYDYTEVFMQSSMDFYDDLYNETEVSEELKAARNIKRVYKVYEDYLKAVEVRNAYIDSLVEKYGGEDEFQRLHSMMLIKDWIPKMPILSRKCPDYDLYRANKLPRNFLTFANSDVNETMQAMIEACKDSEVSITCGVEDNIARTWYYERYCELGNENLIPKKYMNEPVTIKDLNDLSKTFNSWYENDDDDNKDEDSIIFSLAPENIRKRFEEQRYFNHPGLLARYANGEFDYEIEPQPDLNEMVYDDVSGRTMTRGQLDFETTLRVLEGMGYDKVKFRRYYEQDPLEELTRPRGRRRPNNGKRPATPYGYDLTTREESTRLTVDRDNMSQLVSEFSALLEGDI